MIGIDAVKCCPKALAAINGRTKDHAHLVNQSHGKETAIDVAAAHHTDALGAKLAMHQGCGTGQVHVVVSSHDIGDAAVDRHGWSAG